jgi:predicted  nucleic acid-binding Zn-ribbon protein
MVTVEEDIKLLIRILQKDAEIKEKHRFLETAPNKIHEIEKQLSSMEERLHEAQESVEKLNKEKVRLDMDVKDDNALIDKKKNEQLSCKTNEEYRAKTLEIEYLVRKIDKAEERVLVILDQLETRKKEAEAATRQINEEKDSLLSRKNSLEKELEQSKNDLAVLEDEKIRIIPHLSDRIRKLHERIQKGKGDSAVANLIGDICQGCFSRVPPQKAHEVRRNDAIITCEACGRILVYYLVD